MIIKGYWEVTFTKSLFGNYEEKRIIKARNAQKAVKKFYTCDDCWHQKHGYFVVCVEPHSVKEVVNGNE